MKNCTALPKASRARLLRRPELGKKPPSPFLTAAGSEFSVIARSVLAPFFVEISLFLSIFARASAAPAEIKAVCIAVLICDKLPLHDHEFVFGSRSCRRSWSLSRRAMSKQEDEGSFYVVKKGDLIGVYRNLSDCQAQAGSSVNFFLC